MQALPAINTSTLQKANVPECKEIFENFQENFPGIRCFQCRKIHVLIYTQKIEILAPLFYKIFLNKNLTNKEYALRRIKKRSGRFCPDLFIMAFDATSYKSSASPIGRRKDSTISRIPSLNP